MKNRVIWGITIVLVIASLMVGLVACASPASTSPTPTTPTAPTQPKTLKVALNMASNWPIGLDCVHMVEIDVEKVNKDGGLDIGGEKYLIEFIYDDTKMDMAQVKALGEKEIFQDKVKFILGDPWSNPLLQLCEDNKVVGVLSAYDLESFSPELHWIWGAGCGTATYPATILYAANRFPDKKTFLGVYPDRMDGHFCGALDGHFAKMGGLTVLEDIYYPPTATDLSAVGTKVKAMNPDFLVPMEGSPPLDAGVMKAAYAAGWRGQILGAATVPGGTVMAIAGPEAVEGMVAIAWPFEFEPATTPEAQEFKDAYKARFGKWDYPEPVMAYTWFSLKAALQQAGSVDPEKVKAALDNGNGHPFVCPLGTGERFPRLDQNNPRTVDSVIGNLPVKQIVNGQVEHIDTISLDQQLEFVNKAYSAPW